VQKVFQRDDILDLLVARFARRDRTSSWYLTKFGASREITLHMQEASSKVVSGWVSPGFEGVLHAFELNFQEDKEIGASCAAFYKYTSSPTTPD